MNMSLTIRRAAPDDLVPMTALLRELGYPAEAERVAPTLRQLLDDPGASVLVATEDGRGVVGLLSLSCRPVLRLQGIAGTIEELADSMIYGWARLEGSHPALPALTHTRHREIA